MVEYMELSEICKKYAPAYGESWDNWFSSKTHLETTLVSRLAAELEENGEFEEPVILCEDEWDNGEFYPATIANGMHRLSAHNRAGISKVKISHEYPKVSEYEYLDVHLTNYDDNDLDLLDYFIDEMSWRVEFPSGSTWLRLETVGSSNGKVSILLYGYNPKIGSVKDYRKAISERIKNLSPEASVESVEILESEEN